METAALGLDEEQAGEEDEGRGSEEDVEDETMEEWYALDGLDTLMFEWQAAVGFSSCVVRLGVLHLFVYGLSLV